VSFPSRRFLVPFPPEHVLPLVPLARGTHRWVPPFCARIVTPSTRPPYPFARCGVTMPSHSWALLPVLLLLSLLLPVAAEWRMEKQRAGEASCYIECRIRGKLHSLPSPSLWPAYRSFYPTSPFSLRFSEKFWPIELSAKTCRWYQIFIIWNKRYYNCVFIVYTLTNVDNVHRTNYKIVLNYLYS